MSFMPEHPQARQMLTDLGYELPTSQYASVEQIEQSFAETRDDQQPMMPSMDPSTGRSELDNVPLPSYDLEEVDPSDAMSSPDYDVSTATYETQREGYERQNSLPSFPIKDEEGTQPAAPRPSAPNYEPRLSTRPGGGDDLIED